MKLKSGDLVRFQRNHELWGKELKPITGIVLGVYILPSVRGTSVDIKIIENNGMISNYIITNNDHIEVLSETR